MQATGQVHGVRHDQRRAEIEAYQKGWKAYEEKRETETEILSQALQTMLTAHDSGRQDRAEILGSESRGASDVRAPLEDENP